jgi:hypothetical protein
MAEDKQSWNLYAYGRGSLLSGSTRMVVRWAKVAKVAIKIAKTGDAAVAFADNLEDAATVLNPAAPPSVRISPSCHSGVSCFQ